ncbi:MAG: hypothetical protein FWG33_02910, partial [Oscillospiraceae bacterium]|nr:hypothetical protein [Oscillospiraceae bacterium]
DGAAVLKALNRLCGGVFTEKELLKFGSKLGADVPFCLVGGRAECRGIGDIITPLPDLSPRFYVIVQPDFYCDTKSAYRLYKTGFKRGNRANIFQELYKDSRIDKICEELLDSGAETASMSGSGSAVFGVFMCEETAKAAAEKLNRPFKTIARNVISSEKE